VSALAGIIMPTAIAVWSGLPSSTEVPMWIVSGWANNQTRLVQQLRVAPHSTSLIPHPAKAAIQANWVHLSANEILYKKASSHTCHFEFCRH